MIKPKDSANKVACWNTEKNPTDQLKEMFVDIVQDNRIKLGQYPARRPVFLKPHGVAHGRFEILPNLPDKFKIGVFNLKDSLTAWVRFSSDTTPTSPDFKTTCGIAIKLFGIKGKKLLGEGDTHDFIMQNHDVFFVDTAQDMAEFTTAGVIDRDYDAYLEMHPKTKAILNEMAKPESSSLTATYWGVLPYSFGKDHYVKYKLVPEDQLLSQPFDDSNYLAIDLQNRLLHGPAKFKFMVQFRTYSENMPLDQATVRWEESMSPPIHIATLILPQQDITEKGQAEYGENLAYNPWHCLIEHEPQGSIAAARKVVYEASSNNRRKVNGIPQSEPINPPSTFSDNSSGTKQQDTCIVRAAIHPSIGIARLGNSKNEYFIGPEVINPIIEKPGFYRDKHGALKRQAARFRIYGLNAKGEAVKELTLEEAEIEWGVHLANKKSSWYQFQLALDVPEASSALPSLLRNSTVSDRERLLIDGGYKKITSDSKKHKFEGEFMGIPVYLGEAQTDEEGRLIVLGGYGKAASYDGTKAVTFANNEGWYDDISDGPVTAKVKLKGVELKVDPAWIVVAPPNYAPLQKSVRTMWDLIRDVCVQNGMLEKPTLPSFESDIRPIFERMSNLQWVNAGFAAAFGWNSSFNFSSAELMAKLSDPTPANREMRNTLVHQFRNFERDQVSPIPFPWLYGDAMSIPAHFSRQHTTLTDLQMEMLKQWAIGNFINDYKPIPQPIYNIEELPIAEQPTILDRTSLEYCLADAFHPGCEMTWPMRNPKMYMSAFRIKHVTDGWKEPNYGAELNSDVIDLPNGPIAGGQLPGGITRWMAVPWQTDTASCRSGYDKSYDPYLPTFWPARVPNQVLLEKDYDMVINQTIPIGERLQAFANRASWLVPLGLDRSYTDQINNMINNFDHMSVIEARPGPINDLNFPSVIQVAEDTSKHPVIQESFLKQKAILPTKVRGTVIVDAVLMSDETDLTKIDKVQRFSRAKG